MDEHLQVRVRPCRPVSFPEIMVKKLANIKDVAKLAGVSISTVSHVTRGSKFVSPALRDRVLAAVRKLEYEVNPVASGLKSKVTRVIGVVIPNISSIFFPEILKGIQDYASQAGYRLTFSNTGFDLDREIEVLRILEGSWVDGIILDSLAGFEDTDYLDFLNTLGGHKKRIPIVSLERRVHSELIRSVRIDNYQGACIATRHLADCGCRRIAHIAGPQYSSVADARRIGYRDVVINSGLHFGPEMVVEGDFSPREGYRAMQELLRRVPDLDGVLAANDQMAIGAMKAIREAGIEIPARLKVVGFDNVFVASLVEPSLTTVKVPRYQMGYEAAKLLISSIDKTAECDDILLPISLVVRGSTSSEGDREWDLISW